MDLLEIIKDKTFLFDGGIGTQLQAKGLGIGEAPERWNLEKPKNIIDVHQAYVKAGAQAVTTNSFGGTPFKLKSSSLEDKTYLLNKTAASLAKKAVLDNALVAGSIGPTGALLLMDDLDVDSMLEGFKLQIEGLIDGGVDILIIETMSDIEEAKIALRAAKQQGNVPVICSMTFELGANGYRTMMGIDIPTAVKELEQNGADIVGSNCGVGIDNAIQIVAEMRKVTALPIIAEPNAGLPKLVDGKTKYMESPAEMAGKIQNLIKAGANIVGGCCGTTPEHISEFRKML